MTEPESPPAVSVSAEFAALVVRPGDTLIVRTPERMSDYEHDQFLTGLKAGLPDVNVVVIDNVEQLLVYRPNEIQAEPEQRSEG